MIWLCRLGMHRWITTGTIAGISRLECMRCGKKRLY